jgi:hypothetical protein
MERRYERGQLVLPAVILVAIGGIAATEIVINSDRPAAHHATPHEIVVPTSVAREGGVEAPPSLSTALHPQVTLTHQGILETGGVAAP